MAKAGFYGYLKTPRLSVRLEDARYVRALALLVAHRSPHPSAISATKQSHRRNKVNTRHQGMTDHQILLFILLPMVRQSMRSLSWMMGTFNVM